MFFFASLTLINGLGLTQAFAPMTAITAVFIVSIDQLPEKIYQR